MQGLCMFIGESICLMFYVLFNMKAEQDPNKQTGGFKRLAIPAFFDVITSSFLQQQLQHFQSSYSRKNYHYNNQLGFFWLFQVYSLLDYPILYLENNQKVILVGKSNQFRFSQSFYLYLLKPFHIFQQFNYHVFYVVDMEGIWGLLTYGILIPILNFLPCNFHDGCVFRNNKGYFESTDLFFQQLGSDLWLTLSVILGIFSISLYKIFGVNVTKHASSLTRSVVDTIRIIFIWVIGLIVTAIWLIQQNQLDLLFQSQEIQFIKKFLLLKIFNLKIKCYLKKNENFDNFQLIKFISVNFILFNTLLSLFQAFTFLRQLSKQKIFIQQQFIMLLPILPLQQLYLNNFIYIYVVSIIIPPYELFEILLNINLFIIFLIASEFYIKPNSNFYAKKNEKDRQKTFLKDKKIMMVILGVSDQILIQKQFNVDF
ncbi:unnamed protein product [Paramecium primaurelia]|uniref:Transmembrane protein n=1 Tax=Paramecium primaurelia TaxID=5886 RepID=A0A8S1MM73_PARPR|nr:unnamed protein product [Paramecium primaurelia]